MAPADVTHFTSEKLKGHRQQHILFHGIAEQTDDRTELCDQVRRNGVCKFAKGMNINV